MDQKITLNDLLRTKIKLEIDPDGFGIEMPEAMGDGVMMHLVSMMFHELSHQMEIHHNEGCTEKDLCKATQVAKIFREAMEEAFKKVDQFRDYGQFDK